MERALMGTTIVLVTLERLILALVHVRLSIDEGWIWSELMSGSVAAW